MLGTELVYFVMHLIRYPKLLIILSVVQHSVVHKLLSQLIHNLHLVKIDQSAIRCSTGNVGHHVSLNTDFHLNELLIEGYSEVKARLRQRGFQNSKSFIDADVAFLDLMEA